jgi:uncharacterized RDD family membrane protein YckC
LKHHPALPIYVVLKETAMSPTIEHETLVPVGETNLEGVLSRRVLAFLVDAIIVFLLCIPVAVVIFLLGIITLGLGFFLYALMFPVIAIAYVAFTMGGQEQATIGMRVNNIRIARLNGSKIDPITAGVHSVLFWAGNTILTPLVLLVALFSDRKRTLHDLLLGTIVVRSDH